MLFSVGLIFGHFFRAMTSRANNSRRLFATLTGPRCLSSALWDFGAGGRGGADAFSTMANKRQFTVFHGTGSDFQIQRTKSKLFFTDALNTCNKCIRVHCTLHGAVTGLSDISIEGFISKFLHVYASDSKQYYFQGFR